MARYFCRAVNCQLAYSHVKARENHENMMHGQLWEDLVMFLVKKVIKDNPQTYQKKAIDISAGQFSYQEALDKLQNDAHGQETKPIFDVLKNTLTVFYMMNPEAGFIELKKV